MPTIAVNMIIPHGFRTGESFLSLEKCLSELRIFLLAGIKNEIGFGRSLPKCENPQIKCVFDLLLTFIIPNKDEKVKGGVY